MSSTAEVGAAQARLATVGVDSRSEEGVTCCYAVQDKIWVEAPDATAWEIYTVLADAPAAVDGSTAAELQPAGACRTGNGAAAACC